MIKYLRIKAIILIFDVLFKCTFISLLKLIILITSFTFLLILRNSHVYMH